LSVSPKSTGTNLHLEPRDSINENVEVDENVEEQEDVPEPEIGQEAEWAPQVEQPVIPEPEMGQDADWIAQVNQPQNLDQATETADYDIPGKVYTVEPDGCGGGRMMPRNLMQTIFQLITTTKKSPKFLQLYGARNEMVLCRQSRSKIYRDVHSCMQKKKMDLDTEHNDNSGVKDVVTNLMSSLWGS
jgi:hypothetical protein